MPPLYFKMHTWRTDRCQDVHLWIVAARHIRRIRLLLPPLASPVVPSPERRMRRTPPPTLPLQPSLFQWPLCDFEPTIKVMWWLLRRIWDTKEGSHNHVSTIINEEQNHLTAKYLTNEARLALYRNLSTNSCMCCIFTCCDSCCFCCTKHIKNKVTKGCSTSRINDLPICISLLVAS